HSESLCCYVDSACCDPRVVVHLLFLFFFFFTDTATTEIYTLSLHDALPISCRRRRIDCRGRRYPSPVGQARSSRPRSPAAVSSRSEEHTSELQSRRDLVCRLLLEKKKKTDTTIDTRR